MKGKPISYSDDELRWIKRNCDMTRADLHALFCKMFGRTDVSVTNIKALCKRHGWYSGRTGRFTPGQTAHNKGKKTGPAHPNTKSRQFRPGQVPHNCRPLGSERLTADGYIEVKVQVPNPYTTARTRFIHKHRYLWEQVNGPLPRGMALKCLDGDKTNTDPANWEAIPRAMLPRLNGKFGRDYDTAPPEVKPTLLAIAKLEHMARELRQGKEGDHV